MKDKCTLACQSHILCLHALLLQAELTALQPQLEQSTIETQAALVVIQHESAEADKVKQVVSTEEAAVAAEAAKVQAIKDECETDLAEALPALQSAVRALDTLTKADITELKGMKSPPAGEMCAGTTEQCSNNPQHPNASKCCNTHHITKL